MTNQAWRARAACSQPDMDPDIWFPDNEVGAIGKARAICARCPVRAQCLDDILDAEGGRAPKARFGVYAGLTPRQRAHQYRARRVRETAS